MATHFNPAAPQGQHGIYRPQEAKNGFCEILIKIAKVATPIILSIGSFALLPPQVAIVVTAIIVLASLFYLFRNVRADDYGPSYTSVDLGPSSYNWHSQINSLNQNQSYGGYYVRSNKTKRT